MSRRTHVALLCLVAPAVLALAAPVALAGPSAAASRTYVAKLKPETAADHETGKITAKAASATTYKVTATLKKVTPGARYSIGVVSMAGGVPFLHTVCQIVVSTTTASCAGSITVSAGSSLTVGVAGRYQPSSSGFLTVASGPFKPA